MIAEATRESGSEPGTIACISITALLGSVLALLRREKNKDIMGEKDRLSLGAATSESLTDMVFMVSRVRCRLRLVGNSAVGPGKATHGGLAEGFLAICLLASMGC